MEPLAIDGLPLRRAVLGTLLAAGRPMTTQEVRASRVREVATATFEIIPSSVSRSTRRRCLRWQRQLAELVADIHEWKEATRTDPGLHLCLGSPYSDAKTHTTCASE